MGKIATIPLKLLLPYDGSPASRHAVAHVARGMQGIDFTVHLVNVQLVYIDAEMRHATRTIAEIYRAEGERVLRSAAAMLDEHGIDYSAEVAFGRPVDAIARLAAERGSDYVVMGTRARHPLVGLVTASVPQRVARRSTVPVVLVPLHAAAPARAGYRLNAA